MPKDKLEMILTNLSSF